MKKIFQFLSIFFIAFLLTGCHQNGNPDYLTFSTWGSQTEIKIIKSLINDFTTKTNIKVKIIHIPQNYYQKLHLLFASKQEPDVIFINNYYLPLYAKSNHLLDLTNDFEVEKNNYFQNSLRALSVDNKLYAIPRDISSMVVYYNKDIFKQKNIAYPNKNWTIDDFFDDVRKISDGNIFGINLESDIIYWQQLLWSNNEFIFNNDGDFVLSKNTDTLKKYIELRTKDIAAPTKAQIANKTTAQLFLEQKIAMQISGRWLVPKYRNEARFDWDIINLPNGINGSVSASDSSGWAVSKNTKKKEEAIKLIKFLSSSQSIEKLAKTGLITPARKDIAYSDLFLRKDLKPSNSIIFLEINKNSIKTPLPDNYNKKIEKLNYILEPYFNGIKKINTETIFEI